MDARLGVQRRLQLLISTAVAMGLTTALLLAAPTAASAAVVERISGSDRFATAVAVSQDAFPDPAAVTSVHVATGADFADALAAGAAAARAGGPVLLAVRDQLPDVTRSELRRLRPDEVVIVGGPGAIGAAVEQAIRDDEAIGAEVTRVFGRDRFETAAALARRAFPDGADTVHVATGMEFPDALAGVPAAGRAAGPLLLVARDALPAATREAIVALEPDRAVVLGGAGAVSDAVAAELRDHVGQVVRARGSDRFATSVAVSASTFPAARTAYVATGLDFPDALAGGPAAAHASGPLLLVHRGGVPDGVAAELRRLGVDRIVVLGGRGVLPDAVVEQLRRAITATRVLRPDEVPDLAFDTLTGEDPRQRIAVATLDGAVASVTSPPAGTADRLATFAPDGATLAFIRSPDGEERADDVHIVDVSARGQAGQRLTDLGADARFGGCQISRLRWSPAGDAIAFDCLRGATTPARVGVVSLDGSVALVGAGAGAGTESRNDLAPDFSPDGTRLAFTRVGGGGPAVTTLRTVPTDALESASTEVHSSDQVLFDTAWSPDGSRIAVVEAGGISRSEGRVVVVDIAGGASATYLDGAFGTPRAAGPHHVEQWVGDADLLVRTTATGEEGPQVGLLQTSGAQAGTRTLLVTEADLAGNSVERAAMSPGGTLLHDDLERAGGRFVSGALRMLRADGSRGAVEVGPGNHAGPAWNPRTPH